MIWGEIALALISLADHFATRAKERGEWTEEQESAFKLRQSTVFAKYENAAPPPPPDAPAADLRGGGGGK